MVFLDTSSFDDVDKRGKQLRGVPAQKRANDGPGKPTNRRSQQERHNGTTCATGRQRSSLNVATAHHWSFMNGAFEIALFHGDKRLRFCPK